MSGATVVVSVEIELEWGFHDIIQRSNVSEGAVAERETLGSLLDLCDEVDIPITFNVVGHLLHASCNGEHDSPHEDGWFLADPGTNVDTHPGYYAPDMIHTIIDAETSHEICTHTYSHALFDESDRQTANWELQQTRELFSLFEIPPSRSIVPPRHRTPPKDVLRDFGIDIVRLPMPGFERQSQGRVRKFLSTLSNEIPRSTPRVVDEVVETYCTPHPSLSALYLPNGRNQPHPAFRAIPMWLRRRLHSRQLGRSLDRTIEEQSTLHVWTHLQNISNDAQWPQVASFIRKLGSEREKGNISVLTMGELSEKVLSSTSNFTE